MLQLARDNGDWMNGAMLAGELAGNEVKGRVVSVN